MKKKLIVLIATLAELLGGVHTASAQGVITPPSGQHLVVRASGSQTVLSGSTVASGTYINDAGLVEGEFGNVLFIVDDASAGDATITNLGATSNNASGGALFFEDNSSAGNSVITVNSGSNGAYGGVVAFIDESDGGTARVIVNGNGALSISGLSTGGMNVGSIEGSGGIYLGSKTLTAGGNNLSTTFSGIIQDNGLGGSLVKTGTGTLTLAGTNTYIGSTTVSQGTLVVNGSIATSSGVTVSARATLSGSGNVGALSGGGLIAPGDPQIMTATSVDLSGSMSFTFALQQTGSPTYGNASNSGNDVLHLTGTAPLPGGPLSSINTVNINFTGDTFAPGQLYLGGFYTDAALDTAQVGTPVFNYIGLTGSFTAIYEGMVSDTANFGSGPIDGTVMEFEIIPEPSTLLSAGAAILLGLRCQPRSRR